ncbi:hypothetical protein PBN151_1345 [Paenibacillus sp. NAIST15-1]|nr:hypothetical protein PBN151_1345 [Paenibacillus sp. NAIST15-1]
MPEFFSELFSTENIIKMITTGLPTLLIALLVPLYSVRVALKQFYSQKWWETKAKAYFEIIENLSTLEYIYGEYFEHYVMNSIKFSDEKINSFYEIQVKALSEIKKYSAMGNYIISNEVSEVLKNLLRELDYRHKEGNWFEDIEHHHGAIIECLKLTKESAKSDLNRRKMK